MENRPSVENETLPLDLRQHHMDIATREFYRLRPLVLQNLLWSVEMQGERMTVTASLIDYTTPASKPGRFISRFSRAARLRLLKMVASMDWSSITSGLFITLTYPPGKVAFDVDERNKQRYLFHRYMEKDLGREIPLLWRIEWKRRRSGSDKGNVVPHFHLLAPGCPFIAKEKIRSWWRTILNHVGPLATDVQGLMNAKHQAIYVSKYCAKMPDTSTLDNVPNLNIRGRHYGFHRRRRIPMAPRITFRDLSERLVSELRAEAVRVLPHYDRRFDGGFTLLGGRAKKIIDRVRELALAEGAIAEYDT